VTVLEIKSWFKSVADKFSNYVESNTNYSNDYQFGRTGIHVLLKYQQSIIYLEEDKYETEKHIIISTINIPPTYQQKGIFSDFLIDIEDIAKRFGKYVVVENIHNVNLQNSLLKRGYNISKQIGSMSLTVYHKFGTDGKKKKSKRKSKRKKSRKQKRRSRRY
jgi:hypothetical protein